MKFSVLSVLAMAIASASALSIGLSPRGDQSPLAAGYPGTPIPGGSPIMLCPDAPKDYVDIKSISIDPNPPVAGQNLHIEVEADIKKRIDEGAYMYVEVKLGYIILLKKNFDFCENVAKIDMECPIEPGPLKVSRDEMLPAQIPPGKFVVTAHLFTVDDDPVTCLHAEVTFAR